MKRFQCWVARICALLVLLISAPRLTQAGFVSDAMQMYGFLTQGVFHSSDDNLYGQSDDGISPGLTEIGLNLSYQTLDNVALAARVLYRRAENVDRGRVRLDYGVIDLALYHDEIGRACIRGSTVKAPYGLYNELQDVSFAHPGILLAQVIYFDRSRSLFVSSDGGALYIDHLTDSGDFSFKMNIGLPQNEFYLDKDDKNGARNAEGG